MQPTEAEVKAAQQMSIALLEFIVALEEGRRQRNLSDRESLAPAAMPTAPEAQTARWGVPSAKDQPRTTEALVSVRQVAKLLAVSERTVYALTSPRGPIPAVRFGRVVRYSIEDLRRWVREKSR